MCYTENGVLYMPPRKKYYSYNDIMDIRAIYRVIIGQRSNGKTYGWCRMCLENYFESGKASAYVRRLDEMIKPRIISGLFDPHLDYIKKQSGGDWNGIEYRTNAWTLVRREPDKIGNLVTVAKDSKPFCRSYAVSTVETTKGVDHGPVWSVCFDEFITRTYYLQNEFVMFQNLLSSIIRDRGDVNIFLLANTVSKYCPYWREMGLYRIAQQEQGTIDVYQMGKTGSQIAVEYCAETGGKKSVSEYFAFDNPQLSMITTGAWEIASYRHAPPQMSEHRIHLSFFIDFDGQIIQGDLISYTHGPIIFFHPKTTPIKDPEKSIIYAQDHTDGNPLHQIYASVQMCRAQTIIYDLMRMQKTFFADNETGEAVAAWMKTQNLKARAGG